MRARDTKQEDRILSIPPSLLYTPTHILTADLTVETLYQELQNADLINRIAHRFCGGGRRRTQALESTGLRMISKRRSLKYERLFSDCGVGKQVIDQHPGVQSTMSTQSIEQVSNVFTILHLRTTPYLII